ncbi:MAG: LPS assembly lipoprotein LptE [Planctomycetota bacterium]
MKKGKVANPHSRFTNLACGSFAYHMLLGSLALALFAVSGCSQTNGYSNESLFNEDVRNVYVEMFDNQSFWRGVEYELTDALAKRIEAETPYKIVSSKDQADSIISGRVSSIGQSTITIEREAGRALEREVQLRAVVDWENLRTGDLLIDSKSVDASASYSALQMQSFKYASSLAANKLAQRIVELMENKW